MKVKKDGIIYNFFLTNYGQYLLNEGRMDICSLGRSVFFHGLMYLTVITIVVFSIGSFFYLLFTDPMIILAGAVFIGSVFFAMFGIPALYRLAKRKMNNSPKSKEKSFLREYYEAKKNKYCKFVELENENLD